MNESNWPRGSTPEEYDFPISTNLAVNMSKVTEILGNSHDLVQRHFIAQGRRLGLLFIDELASKTVVDNDILRTLMLEVQMAEAGGISPSCALEQLERHALTIGQVKEARSMADVISAILDGDTAIFGEGWTRALLAGTRGFEKRAIEEPVSEPAVRAPREGFTEDLRTNASLIRRRLKTPDLRVHTARLGARTRTQVEMIYIHGLARQEVVDEVRHRLQSIEIDGILESGYIEELIEEAPWSPFPQIAHTERPDKVVGDLLNGAVCILTDGTPFALLAPVTMVRFFQVPEDYNERWPVAIGVRMFRLIAFFTALLLPALYVALTTFHQEMLPTQLAVSLAAQRERVPYPAVVEALIMQIIFEILLEGGVRLPRAVGSAVTIVGALVIGQAAVQASLLSAAMVIVISLTALASFTIPAYDMATAVRMLRLPMIVVAAVLGLFGVLMGFLALIIHLCSLRSFGVPYLGGIAPFFPPYAQKDIFIRVPWWAMFRRTPVAVEPVREKRGMGHWGSAKKAGGVREIEAVEAEKAVKRRGKDKNKG